MPSRTSDMLQIHTGKSAGGVKVNYTTRKFSPRYLIEIERAQEPLSIVQLSDRDKLADRFLIPTSNSIRRDFQIRVMKYDPVIARQRLNQLSKLTNSGLSVDFKELFLFFRNEYVEKGNQYSLQLASLSLKLEIFSEINKSKIDKLIIKPFDYLKNSITYGANFTLFLKKLRSYATLATISHSHFIDLEEKINELNQNPFNIVLNIKDKFSYDDFLSESYLLFFEEEVDDYSYSFLPVNENMDTIETFRIMIRKVLTEHKVKLIHDPSDDEIITWTSDSASFNSLDPDSHTIHKTRVREEIQKGNKNPYGSIQDNLTFTRSIIPVGPGNFRDSWMPDLGSLFTIKTISYYMRQVIQPIPYSAMYDENIAYGRKKFMRESDSHRLYLLLDFKKSGLTINRRLIAIMGEELSEIYPDVEAFRHIKNCYGNIKVYNKGKFETPVRGTGLGNMNELYTLFQCATGELMKLRYGTKSIFFNDDACIELSTRKWKEQLNFVMNYLSGLGQIVNLAKTVVSRSNIFCEEYIIHNEETYNYNKVQLLLMPFADVLLQSTTASAKRYMYSIDRQLIGTGMRYLTKQFLELAKLIYINEFGNMDYLLPYHLGGWVDFSSNNFSCLIEYMLDPKVYIFRSDEEGNIPEIRRWIQYNYDLIKSDNSILSSASKIRYRKNLENTVKSDVVLDAEDEFSKYVLNFSGMGSNAQYRNMLSDIINVRGLHNAKPKLRFGLQLKEEKRRRFLYSSFKTEKSKLVLFEPRSVMFMKDLLNNIKEMDESPGYFCFPRFLIKESEEILREGSRKVLISQKVEEASGRPVPLIHRRVLSCTIASIQNGYFFPNSDPFIFGDLWRSAKSGYLISDKGVRYRSRGFEEVPYLYECFCPNKKLFIAEIQTRLGRKPLSYHPIHMDHRDFFMYKYKDILEILLPADLIGRWRKIKKMYSKHLFELKYILSQNALKNRHDYEKAMDILEIIYEEDLSQEYQDDYDNLPEGYEQFFARVDQNVYLEKLIEDKLTVEDLIEEYEDYNFSESEYGSDYEDHEDWGKTEFELKAKECKSPLVSDSDQDSSHHDQEEEGEVFSEYESSIYNSDFLSQSEDEGEEEDEILSDSEVERLIEELDELNVVDESALKAVSAESPNSIVEDTEEEEEWIDQIKFNRFGVGLGEWKSLRLNLHTLEIWDIQNSHDMMKYQEYKSKGRTEIFLPESFEEIYEEISLNEMRRLYRHEAAAIVTKRKK